MSVLLEIDALAKTFGGLTAVDDISFDVAPGEILGLIGPNGSGKTTVLNLISGALKPSRGVVRLRQTNLVGLPPHRIVRLGISRTFQLVRVFESMTCRENVKAGMAFSAQPLWGTAANRAAERLLERVGLGAVADTLAGELTYINQKRLELARALAARPRLLLLDEWLAGLTQSELMEGVTLLRALREEGATMVLVEHVMDAIRALCDRCVVMSAGRKIADAPPTEALSDREVVRAYLGDDDA